MRETAWCGQASPAIFAFDMYFGQLGLVPVSGDFDGDGLADMVVYETATSTWTFRLSSMGYVPLKVVF